jgi:hypothetical protein
MLRSDRRNRPHASRERIAGEGRKKWKRKKKKGSGPTATVPPTSSGTPPGDPCAGVECEGTPNGFTFCQNGRCVTACAFGYKPCGSECVVTQTDTRHCGTCGHGCPAPSDETMTPVCGEGICQQVRPQDVVISQIYGGGGTNSSGLYNRDYIELYNRGLTDVNINFWSVQYAGTSNTTWNMVQLFGTIPVGGHFLIAGALSFSSSQDLPVPPDIDSDLEVFAANGRVALVQHDLSIATRCNNDPSTCASGDPLMADFVGYGTAISWDGNGQAPSPGTQFALWRRGDGCTDTNDNKADFTVSPPQPRNSSSVNACPWAGDA